jgi:hypothetical protein
MTKRSHDLLRNVLDELCVTPIYTAACARCGISTKTLWRYVRASQHEDDPEKYWFVWSDTQAWFHDHLKHAMRMSALMIEATARHHALNGFDEVQVFQGKMCWKEDPALAGLSDKELSRLGRSDRYERNPDGTLIPLTVRRKPSDQLVLKMLASHFPRTYGDKVEHQYSNIIPVVVMGRDGKLRRPNMRPAPELEDRSEELVARADNGEVEPGKMKFGLILSEPMDAQELEQRFSGERPLQEVEFEGLPDTSEQHSALTVRATPVKAGPSPVSAAGQGRAKS